MAKKGLKVKELAQELGVTSRELIDRCREHGLAVQNSITRIPPTLLPAVRGYFSSTRDSSCHSPGLATEE